RGFVSHSQIEVHLQETHPLPPSELSRILESTRDHLESQLSRAEAEKTQLAAQIQVCEHQTQSLGLL
uniref:Uncharacterized protein n=1 Tax=Seriola lalandi dorsalis TaxID=1841481 RepID=A0A3B4YRC6_SERLL